MILLDSSPTDGGNGPATNETPTTPVTPPAAPPAAETVIKGTKSEREIQLEETLAERERRLSEHEAARKKAETDAAYLADENRRLKEIGLKPEPAPAPRAKKGAGWTFFEEED
jgi:hypothetical protein